MKPLRSVLRHVRHYRLPLTLTVVSMLALVGIQLVAPWLVRTMIAAVTESEAREHAADDQAFIDAVSLDEA